MITGTKCPRRDIGRGFLLAVSKRDSEAPARRHSGSPVITTEAADYDHLVRATRANQMLSNPPYAPAKPAMQLSHLDVEVGPLHEFADYIVL
jgi:hypothetical protein